MKSQHCSMLQGCLPSAADLRMLWLQSACGRPLHLHDPTSTLHILTREHIHIETQRLRHHFRSWAPQFLQIDRYNTL